MSTVETSVLAEAGIRHVSASSLNRFVRCAESYRQRYVLGQRDPAGPKALLGSADSKAFEAFYLQRMTSEEGPSLEVVRDIFRDTLLDQADKADYNLEGETTDKLIDTGIPTIDAYYAVAQTMPTPIAVEQKIVIERDSLPVPIIGYTDVEFEAFGIDRKGAANRSVHPDWRLQTRIYSAAQSKPWGLHVTTRTKVPAVYTPADGPEYEEPWSAARAAKTVRMVGQVMAQIESCLIQFGPDNEWPTTGLVHVWSCSKCAYRSGCSAWA